MLDAAVAAGREFEFKVIAWAAGLSENAALDAIDELRAARLIEPRGDGLHYAFDHNLTMEVAYREIGEPRHRLLHHRVAEALETIHRHNLDSISGLLAWHFAESGDIDRAAPHAFRAGQLAAELAAWKEALAFHKQALSADSISPQQRANILAALGEAHLRIGESAQATEAFREALALSPSSDTVINTARLGLGQALISQARFAEAIALAKQLLAEGQPQHALNAEVLWGTALSIEGADLAGAAEHLNKADALCAAQADPARRAQINFELGSVAAQQGDLDKAVALYRATLAIADEAGEAAFVHQILARNNLAYHLHLLGDPTAIEYAEDGLRLAQAKGALGLQPFLDSTLGEIALAQGDLDSAEKYFADGLALAERISLAERIAGLTANLGLVAHRRGDTALAIHRLSTALVRADTLGTQHLAAQIRLWLVPLLPPTEARAYLAEARAIAGSSGRKRLLEEAEQLQNRLG